jgi:hypothetical protein
MASKYHIRQDVTTERSIKTTHRNYLTKMIEEPTLLDLDLAVNAFLLLLPTAVHEDTRVQLMSQNNYVYGAGGGVKHVSVLTFYLTGLVEELVLP